MLSDRHRGPARARPPANAIIWALILVLLLSTACRGPATWTPAAGGIPATAGLQEGLSDPGGIPHAGAGAGAPPAPADRRRSIGLSEVLEQALSGNLDLALARAEEQVAGARASAAEGRLYPQLELGGGAAKRNGRVQGSFGVLRDVHFNTFDPGVALAYRLNLGREIYRTIAARRELDETVYRRLDTEQRLLLRVSELYQDLVLTRAGMKIAAKRVADGERLVAVARARLQAQVGARSDLARAEAKLARERRGQVEARSLWEAGSVRLAVTLATDPRVLLEPAAVEPAPRSLVPEGSAWDPEGEALHRPGVVAARLALEAAGRDATAAWWDILGPELEAEIGETFIGDQLHELHDRADFGVFLSWTFSFEKLGRLREGRARERAASLEVARSEKAAAGEVETARRELAAARETIPLAREGLEAAETSARLSAARFTAGTAIILEVIEAQDAVARARLDLARTVSAHQLAQLRLLAAAGRLAPEAIGAP